MNTFDIGFVLTEVLPDEIGEIEMRFTEGGYLHGLRLNGIDFSKDESAKKIFCILLGAKNLADILTRVGERFSNDRALMVVDWSTEINALNKAGEF